MTEPTIQLRPIKGSCSPRCRATVITDDGNYWPAAEGADPIDAVMALLWMVQRHPALVHRLELLSDSLQGPDRCRYDWRTAPRARRAHPSRSCRESGCRARLRAARCGRSGVRA